MSFSYNLLPVYNFPYTLNPMKYQGNCIFASPYILC